ncbi:MAG: hypothetical protein KDA80_21000 [Planctomycetaceae bacterium]|nr:hypothetical protein [Planctomycetaceae bacterium]
MPAHPDHSPGEAIETPVPDAKMISDARGEFAEKTLRHRERHFIENASEKTWPRYPLLCVVHRREYEGGGSPFLRPGLIHASELTTVAAINLYELPAYGGSITEQELEQRMHRYHTIDELLQDWTID